MILDPLFGAATRMAVLLALVTVSSGCSKSAPDPAPSTEPAGEPGAQPSPVASAADPSFTIRTPDVTLQATQPGAARLEVVPNAPWKMNLEYPTRVRVAGSSSIVRAPQPELKNNPGGESQLPIIEKGLTADVPLEGLSRGAEQVTAEVRFAVCTPETCVPKTATVTWNVTVE